jgi:hypothetical protein
MPTEQQQIVLIPNIRLKVRIYNSDIDTPNNSNTQKIESNSSLLDAQTASGASGFVENESATDQNILSLDQNSAVNGAVAGAPAAESSIEINISGTLSSQANNTPQLLVHNSSKRSPFFLCQLHATLQ